MRAIISYVFTSGLSFFSCPRNELGVMTWVEPETQKKKRRERDREYHQDYYSHTAYQ